MKCFIKAVIYLSLIGVALSFVIAPNVISRHPPKPYAIRSLHDSYAISTAVDLYVDKYGEYPSAIETLVKAGFLEQLPVDTWGRPYIYSLKKPDAAQDPLPFYVWSNGQDGIAGGSEANYDIGNWSDRAEVLEIAWDNAR